MVKGARDGKVVHLQQATAVAECSQAQQMQQGAAAVSECHLAECSQAQQQHYQARSSSTTKYAAALPSTTQYAAAAALPSTQQQHYQQPEHELQTLRKWCLTVGFILGWYALHCACDVHTEQ